MPETVVVYLRSQPRYGDQVVSYPTLFTLKTWWPGARLRVVSKYDVGRYYTGLPWVDEFVRVATFRDYLAAQPASDCVSVCLHHGSERHGLVNLLRRPKMRLGFRHGRFTDFVWTHSYRKTGREYIGLANLKMLSEVRPVNAPAAIRQCFETVALPAYDRIQPAEVIFIPGGGLGEFKRWSWRYYVRLADLLKRRLAAPTTFTFVLGPGERRELEELRVLGRQDFRLEFGRSISELARLMFGARLVVSNDCGPSHLAQGACVPYVGVLNEPNPEWFWARPHSACVVPDDGTANINSIPAERVLRACLQVMG